MKRQFNGWCEDCASAAQLREEKDSMLRSSCPKCQEKLGLIDRKNLRMKFISVDDNRHYRDIITELLIERGF